MNIEWAPDEDGSIDHGMEYHRQEEAAFLALIDAATPAIEVVLDELETRGHTCLAPSDKSFEALAQRAEVGSPIIQLALACTPALDEPALLALVTRVAGLINREPD